MESHKIWIANLNDLLTNHVCQGLIKTYTEIHRLCGGHKLKLSIQTAMEGIAHLSAHKLNADYKVLIDSLVRIGYNETNLNELIGNAYSSYALSALRSAGIKCDRLDPSLLNGPRKSAFIHEVYINVARHIWTRPDVLIEQNIPQLKIYVREGVEQAVRSGVNLNFIIDALATGSKTPAVASTPSLTIKERLSTLNGGKSILDDDSDDGASDDNTAPMTGGGNKPSNIPDAPSALGEMTIENDDLAPDNMTITTATTKATTVTTKATTTTATSATTATSKTADASLQVNKSTNDDMIINVTTRHVPFELSESASNYTVTEDDEDDEDDEEGDKDDDADGDDEDDEDKITEAVGGGVEGSMYTVATERTVKPVSPKKEVNMVNDTDSLPSFLVVGEIKKDDVQSVRADKSKSKNKGQDKSKEKASVSDGNSSLYSITLLSHRDMLSSRLNRLGL
jgi:hypothetical protein